MKFIFAQKLGMKSVLFSISVLVLLAACSPGKSWEKQAIDNKEKALMDQAKKGKVDTAGVNDLLKAYIKFVDAYPTDTNGANYLFKAADFYRYMHKPLRSIELYARIYNSYPAFEKRPYSLFLQGFIYENEMGNVDSARAKYQDFLDVYPNHAIARDVQITLNNLGKTPEQLVQEFENRAHADSLNQAHNK